MPFLDLTPPPFPLSTEGDPQQAPQPPEAVIIQGEILGHLWHTWEFPGAEAHHLCSVVGGALPLQVLPASLVTSLGGPFGLPAVSSVTLELLMPPPAGEAWVAYDAQTLAVLGSMPLGRVIYEDGRGRRGALALLGAPGDLLVYLQGGEDLKVLPSELLASVGDASDPAAALLTLLKAAPSLTQEIPSSFLRSVTLEPSPFAPSTLPGS